MEGSYLVLILMLALSAFCSGSEMAFMSSNKLLLEINRNKHPRISKIIDVFLSKPDILISTILVGNNVALVIFGLEFGYLFGPYLSDNFSSPSIVLFIQTIISTIVIIVTAEFLPKTIIQINPTTMLNVLAIPLFILYVIFYPIGRLTQKLAHFFIKHIFKATVESNQENWLPGRVDLDNLLEKQASTNSNDATVSQEARLMKNALDFSNIKVRDCAVPRTEIVAVDIDDSIEELKKKYIDTKYSKILVYQDNIDNIVGYVHVSEMFHAAKSIRSMMTPIVVVPETMRANTLLKLFTEQHKSVAIVVDEFGGTAGMITLEDVLEEIFGEINDEHDTNDLEEKLLDDGDYVFSSRLEIDYLNEKYNLNLPKSDDYDTLAGLILNKIGSIPKAGDLLEFDNFEIKILTTSSARIETVKLSIKK